MKFSHPFKEVALYNFDEVSLFNESISQNLLNKNVQASIDDSCTHVLNCSLSSGSYVLDLIAQENSFHDLNLNIEIEKEQHVSIFIYVGGHVDSKFLSKVFGQIRIQNFATCHIYWMPKTSNYYKHQFVSNIAWFLDENSSLDLFVQESSGLLEHHQHSFYLKKESNLKMRGMIVSSEGSYKSIRPHVIHQEESAESDIRIKSLLQGPSKTSILGKIEVLNGAKNIKGAYQNNNLMLNNGAYLTAEPELDIDFDDIACSHGVTIGTLDPAACFYLQSRGLSLIEAKKILMTSFLKSIVPATLMNIDFINYAEDLDNLLTKLQGAS